MGDTCEVYTHQVVDTEYCADSVEWCPLVCAQHLALCGTYQLQEPEADKTEFCPTAQKRLGRLYLYGHEYVANKQTLCEYSRDDMPGILDIKWSSSAINGHPCFALVNSVGQLRVYGIQDNKVILTTEEALGEDCLGLSLEWNNTVKISDEPMIAASDSKGRVSVYRLGGGALHKTATWPAHDFEAWIIAFNQWHTDILYSGGDDCKLKVWDLRLKPGTPVMTSKRHTMGVCSIQSSHVQEHILATGSYDEQLLIWDSRQMKRPLAETGLGGGIWRIKWEPVSGLAILTATMYNGFHIVDTSIITEGTLPVMCHYKEHQSIAYGADWCRGQPRGQTSEPTGIQSLEPCSTIATCSFYDNTLRLWNFKTTIKDT